MYIIFLEAKYMSLNSNFGSPISNGKRAYEFRNDEHLYLMIFSFIFTEINSARFKQYTLLRYYNNNQLKRSSFTNHRAILNL